MVYGCLYCARSYEKTLSTLNFAGSKFSPFFIFNFFKTYSVVGFVILLQESAFSIAFSFLYINFQNFIFPLSVLL